MTDIVKELDTALAILSALSVSGNAVDAMAAAKAKIRKAKTEIEKRDNKEAEPDGR